MRKVIFLIIIILSLPSALWATDPIIGAWKLNVAKSIMPPEQSVSKEWKEWTEVYREVDTDQVEFRLIRIRNDGSQTSEKLIWPQQGGIVHFL